jgi:hypothetical protein
MNSARRKVREVEFRKNNEGLQMFLCLPEGFSAIRNAIITAVDSFDQDKGREDGDGFDPKFAK